LTRSGQHKLAGFWPTQLFAELVKSTRPAAPSGLRPAHLAPYRLRSTVAFAMSAEPDCIAGIAVRIFPCAVGSSPLPIALRAFSKPVTALPREASPATSA